MRIAQLMVHFERILVLDSKDAQDRYLAQLAIEDAPTGHELQRLVDVHRIGESLHDMAQHAQPRTACADDLGLPANFRVQRRLGEGAMSTVYLAEQTSPVRRLVAIKIMLAMFSSARFAERFQSEFQTLLALRCPHVAQVYDAGVTVHGRPYFVMEFIAGQPITTYCDEHQLTLEARVTLVAEICSALQSIHSQGIVHRDLKPQNILVRNHQADDGLKIIDFGVAKVLDRDSPRLNVLTCVGDLMGTPAYMSPEQAEGRLDIDGRADVYSLGAVLYELMAGSPPILGSKVEHCGLLRVIELIKHEIPQRPSERVATDSRLESIAHSRQIDKLQLLRSLSGDLDRIVAKAMAKDRQDRYQSVSAMAADLGNYLAGRPVIAAAPPLVRRTAKMLRKFEQTLLVSAICTILAISATLFTVSTLKPTTSAALLPASFQRFECFEDEPVEIPVLRESKLGHHAWIVTAVNCLPVTTEQRVAVAGGTVILTQSGNILFTPSMDRSGPVAFTFTLANKLGHQMQGAIHGHVLAVVDRPVVYWKRQSPNYVQNGQFKDLADSEDGGFVRRNAALSGWEQTAGKSFEARPAFPPGAGNAIKLDVGFNCNVSQQLKGLVAGQSYILTFASAAWDDSATLQLLWGGKLLKTITPASLGSFMTNSVLIESGSGDGSDRLEFREAGLADNRGTWLSNVRVWSNLQLTLCASAGETVRLPRIDGETTDTDGSESLQIILANLPSGLVLSDGVNSYYENDKRMQDITQWNRDNLWLTTPTDGTGSHEMEIVVTATENSSGHQAIERRAMHIVYE